MLQTTMTGTFIGACIGGFVFSKSAYINFVENNQATIFKSTNDAKVKQYFFNLFIIFGILN